MARKRKMKCAASMFCHVERSRDISQCLLGWARDSSRPSHKATAWQATSRLRYATARQALGMTRNDDVNLRCVTRHLMTSRFRFGFLALTWLVTSTETFAVTRTALPDHTKRLATEQSPYPTE